MQQYVDASFQPTDTRPAVRNMVDQSIVVTPQKNPQLFSKLSVNSDRTIKTYINHTFR